MFGCRVLYVLCDVQNRELMYEIWFCFFFQAEDGIRDLVRSRGLGDVYKRQDVRVLEAPSACKDVVGGAGSGEHIRFALGSVVQHLSLIHI